MIDGIDEGLCVARRLRIGLGQYLGKPTSDNGRNLRHQIGDFLPFMRKQIHFELRMDRPLRLNL